MTNERLNAVKKFASENFSKDEPFTVDVVMPETEEEVACSSIWYDRSGRFVLNDVQAVEEWGLVGVLKFIKETEDHINFIERRCP